MDDISKILAWLAVTYFAIVRFLYGFAVTSPVTLGYLLVGTAVAVKIYQKRRQFYADRNMSGDWEPRYGAVVANSLLQKLLEWAFSVILLLGILIIVHVYFPEIFRWGFNLLMGNSS